MIMSLGLVGRKVGMTRVFTDDGISIPVTVLEVVPNRVTQIKTIENDGYQAVQVAYGNVKPSKLNKPTTGHYAKAAKEAGVGLKEFKLNSNDDFFYQKNYIKIDNTHLTAHDTAHKIIEAFEFEEV